MRAVVSAYGKINLFLDVLGKREDGFHEVKMVMQAIKLADYVSLMPWEENILLCSSKFLPTNKNNLALKALILMQENFPELPKIRINLEKHLPVAAGLAGGSSDAAAVLLGLNELFKLNLSLAEMQNLAAQIGSDVPFCLTSPTALASGRGEIITPLEDLPPMYVVLAKPQIGAATAQVYKNLTPEDYAIHPSLEDYLTALKAGDRETLKKNIYNVLEKSTFRLVPKVAQMKEQFIALGAPYTLMSGSGTTLFSLFDNSEEAFAFYRKIKTRYKTSFFTETLTSASTNERVKIYED